MAYVAIDIAGARDLAKALQDSATRAEAARRETVGALKLADLSSQAPLQLGLVQDGFTRLASGVVNKADLAEQALADPQRVAAGLGVDEAQLRMALTDQIGFGGPRDLRSVLVGLASPGTDPALDAALARLGPTLVPALLAGKRLELDPAGVADLRIIATGLGIAHAGPSLAEGAEGNTRTGTEVFFQDFWADGRTASDVFADPQKLMDWVAGTFELDRRLALATGLPSLGDAVASYDFATTGGSADVATLVAEAEASFAAVSDWLPAFLVGQDGTPPDPVQLEQTLAFARRVGWADPDPEASTAAGTATAVTTTRRFDDAIAYLRANRILQSALLPTGFEGDPHPLAFFNEPGILQILQVGRRSGVIDDTTIAALSDLVDRSFGPQLAGPAPIELTEPVQQRLFATLAAVLGPNLVRSPAVQAQFIASLGYLRQATTGADLRLRIIGMLAAMRTVTVTGPPALTERQLTTVVGDKALGVLGRSRLRLRATRAVQKNPEFLLVARQWGIGGGKQDIGKYKFTWSFDEFGQLVSIRRKKKSWLSRAFDTIKSIGKAIWESWEDNPFKAIFQIGKIALGAAAFFVPGLQGLGLGAVAMALNLGEAAVHAIEGDWLSAIGSGLGAFTAGAEVFGDVASTVVQSSQLAFAKTLFGADFDFLVNAKRAVDIGTSVFRLTQADSLLGSVQAGLGAFATTLGSGGTLLGKLGADASLTGPLVQLGTTARDLGRLVAPAAGLVQAVDSGDLLNAFGNGLLAVSAGATALANPAGAFVRSSTKDRIGFGFGRETVTALRTVAEGTGVAGNVTRAIAAADAGQAFLAGSLLAQAVQAANNPRTTVIGDRALVTQRISELGVVLERVFAGANPKAAAPLVLDGLGRVFDALNTPLAPQTSSAPPVRRANTFSEQRLDADQGTFGASAAGFGVLTAESGSAVPTGGSGDTGPADPPGTEGLAGGESDFVVAGATTDSAQVGGEFASVLAGATDDNILIGGAGDNTLVGGAGDDVLADTNVVTLSGPVGLALYGLTPERAALMGQPTRVVNPGFIGESLELDGPDPFRDSGPGEQSTSHPFLPFGANDDPQSPAFTFPKYPEMAFETNRILDGESSSLDFMAEALLAGQLGIAVRGPADASFSWGGGVKMGFGLGWADRIPAEQEIARSSIPIAGFQFGPFGAATGFTVERNLDTGAEVWDGYAVDNLGLQPNGGHIGFTEEGFYVAPPRDSDIVTALGLSGPGFTVGTEYPLSPELTAHALSWMAWAPLDEVKVNMGIPAGTRLSFDVDHSVWDDEYPTFANRPGPNVTGFDADWEPVAGESLTNLMPGVSLDGLDGLPMDFTPDTTTTWPTYVDSASPTDVAIPALDGVVIDDASLPYDSFGGDGYGSSVDWW